jgi:hypothetical protein
VTTPNRKRIRLIEKLRELGTTQVALKEAPKGAANPASTDFDPEALYISRKTLIDLLEEGWAPGELSELVPEQGRCSACSGSGHYDTNGSPPCGACSGTGYTKG